MNLWPVFQLTKGSDMADYTTVDAVKAYLRITTDSDDTLLADLIRRACRIIDDHCARRFDSWVRLASTTRPTRRSPGTHCCSTPICSR